MALEQKLKPLSERYEHVLVLSLAKVLSGTHDALKHAAENTLIYRSLTQSTALPHKASLSWKQQKRFNRVNLFSKFKRPSVDIKNSTVVHRTRHEHTHPIRTGKQMDW